MLMIRYLTQQQQKQNFFPNMSVSVCILVACFEYLHVSVSVIGVPCERFMLPLNVAYVATRLFY